MSTQTDEMLHPIETALGVIQEATKYVNWKPDQDHSEQARYDALSALNSFHAYIAAVSLETLRRIDPAAADRIAQHLDSDDWQTYCETAAEWNEQLAHGNAVDPDGTVFPKLTGQETTA